MTTETVSPLADTRLNAGNIEARCAELGLTPDALAERLEIPSDTLRGLMSGERHAPAVTVAGLVLTLDLGFAEVLRLV